MNLIDENEEKEQEESKKKILKIIMITIIALVFIAIIIVIISTIKNKNTLKLTVDDKSTDTSGVFLMTDDGKDISIENGNMYISVKKLAAMLGVEYYNDEYKNKGEDKTKCYIKTSNEYTSFISNSSEIYKAVISEEAQETGSSNTTSQNKSSDETEKVTEYEYFTVENGVRYINNEIYASQEAIKLGFNVIISYDQSNKQVSIYTLNNLETRASKKVASAAIGDECSYTNKKLLKYGMVLIKSPGDDGENQYGIVNYNNYQEGDYLVSCKYSEIKFLEGSSSIVVTNYDDGKQGIFKLDLVNGDKAEKFIEPKYQLIKQIDSDSDLYLVKESGKYGIITISGDEVTTVLKSEYQQIGVDYVYTDMDNKYIVNDKYIPVKSDGKWGIAGIDGNLLITPQYEEIGCYLGESGNGDGVIVLPELVNGADAIVFVSKIEEKTNVKTYIMINVQTGEKIGIDANEIYSKFEDNERKYYMKVVDSAGNSMNNINIYSLFGRKVKNAEAEDENSLSNDIITNDATTNNIVTNSTSSNNSQNNTATNSTSSNNSQSSTDTNSISNLSENIISSVASNVVQ